MGAEIYDDSDEAENMVTGLLDSDQEASKDSDIMKRIE